jgi:hypothetical protein
MVKMQPVSFQPESNEQGSSAVDLRRTFKERLVHMDQRRWMAQPPPARPRSVEIGRTKRIW